MRGDTGLDAVISLGAGVQSSTLLLMADRGEIAGGKRPVAAIFADTGWEPRSVYEHLEWLEAEVEIPIHRVKNEGPSSSGNIRDDLVTALKTGRRWVGVPLHIVGERRGNGMLRRQCTREYKVEPIARKLREIGFGPKNPVEQWIGISWDEIQRMKDSRIAWQRNRWPLIESELRRADCLAWFAERYPGRELVKSACLGCPYHNTAGWRDVKSRPEDWADVLEIDALVRGGAQSLEEGTEGFLHYSRRPLTEVDLSTPEERGQLSLLDGEDFDAECEGMCGV